MFCWVFLFTILFTITHCQVRRNCKGEFNNYFICLNKVNEDFNDKKWLNDGQWSQIHNDVKECFQMNYCQHPFHTEAVKNARHSCFIQQRNLFKRDMQECIKRKVMQQYQISQGKASVGNWFAYLPPEALENSVYNRYTNFIAERGRDQFTCSPSVNKGQLNQCVRDKVKQRSVKPRVTGDKCRTKRGMCDQKIKYDCYSAWQRYYRPYAKQCINDLQSSQRLKTFRETYIRCVQQRDRSYKVTNTDPNVQYFDVGRLQTIYGNIQEICAWQQPFTSG